MTDNVPKKTGDSRYLRTALPAGTTWEQALAMWRAGTLPIDLAGINPAGMQVVGTPNNKGTLLSDDTEIAIWGNAADRTVDAALNGLANLRWQLIAEYAVAGPFSWTSDFDGEIGYVVMGGGGSGYSYVSTTTGAGTGGGGGRVAFGTMTVTKGRAISGVIGTGGEAAVATSTKNGNNGGASNFGDLTADGGFGGNVAGMSGSGGGGSEAPGGSAGANGSPGKNQVIGGLGQGLIVCPFDLSLVLSAGGSGNSYNAGGATGYKGRGGYGTATDTKDATGNGNGGAAVRGGSGTVTSGAGSPGLVLIYRKVAAA